MCHIFFFICWWRFRLVVHLGVCKECCSEHGKAGISSKSLCQHFDVWEVEPSFGEEALVISRIIPYMYHKHLMLHCFHLKEGAAEKNFGHLCKIQESGPKSLLCLLPILFMSQHILNTFLFERQNCHQDRAKMPSRNSKGNRETR